METISHPTPLSELVSHFLAILYYWLEGIVLFFVPLRCKAKDITGELVLVTGAGSGIGRLMAVRFAKQGANLALWDLNGEGNEETARLVRAEGAKAYPYSLDVTDAEAVYKTAAQVKQEAGTVTILVNNAGIVTGKRILELEDRMVHKIFDVNAIAHFWTIKAFLPGMLEQDHGHIVCISSLAGVGGIPKLTDYCASKYAAVGLMDALFVELHSQQRKNIHTTTVCPFFINTGMFSGAKTNLFDVLEPEYVADQVLESVLCNKILVYIPRSFYFLLTLKAIMPGRALLALQDFCGGSDSMAEFKGRPNKAQ